jgi:hypothetical protein
MNTNENLGFYAPIAAVVGVLAIGFVRGIGWLNTYVDAALQKSTNELKEQIHSLAMRVEALEKNQRQARQIVFDLMSSTDDPEMLTKLRKLVEVLN